MKSKSIILILNGLLCGGLLLAAGCSEQQTMTKPDGTVASIGDRFITSEDLRAEALRRQDVGLPILSKDELLQGMLQDQALLMRAEQFLANDSGLRKEMEHLLVSRLRERELSERLKSFDVTEETLQAAYQEQIEKYTRPAFDRLAILFLRLERSASATKREKVLGRMNEALLQAEENPLPDGFGSLAIRCSDDQLSRYRGGDIGWVARNKSASRLPDSVLEIGRMLEAGAVSDVIETGKGLYLVKKTDSRPTSVTPYEQVRSSLRRRRLAQGRRSMEEAYLQQCLVEANPRIDEVGFAKFALPSEPEKESVLIDKLPMAAGPASIANEDL